jgi:diguanylate cyclase (GGDEF)-like protein
MVGDHLRLRLELDINRAELANARAIARIGSWEAPVGGGLPTWSPEMFQILDLDPSTAPSADLILERVHTDDRAAVEAAYAAWRSRFADFALDHRLSLGDGTVRWVHQFGLTQRDGAGRPMRQTAIVQDITERKTAEEELQLANIVLKTQMEASELGVLVVDETDRIISFNEKFAQVWDVPVSILESRNGDRVRAAVVASIEDPDATGLVSSLFSADAAPDPDPAEDIETVGGRSLRWRSVVLHGADGRRLGRAWFFSDVTEQKRALAQAIRTSRIDHLTGLANRGAFVEALEAAIAAAKRRQRGFAVLYLDLDHFKDVNDTLGHPAGDELLEAVAGRLRANTRAADTVARFGGDEFAIIADGVVTTEDASALAATLIAALGAPYAVGEVPVRSSASIGIALHTPGSADAETMLSHADLALYQAKAEGRSEYRFFTPAIESEVRTRVELAAELHDAIADDQLFLLYQPQVELAGGRMVGVEALVRWAHPQRGLLLPEVFVPVAERTGVIGKLGQWVLSAACRQARAWLDAGAPPTRLALNVSSLQFRAALAFEADIAAALGENRLAPEHIELELTESVLMNAFREQADLLGRLRAQGMTIAIDDFGTGYSSLDYLRRFPVNRIKIDQIFVGDLEADSGDAAIVKATIGLARELGVQVIAEGVERPGQLDLLRIWGCGEVQGYLIAPPLTAEEITPLLRERRPLI